SFLGAISLRQRNLRFSYPPKWIILSWSTPFLVDDPATILLFASLLVAKHRTTKRRHLLAIQEPGKLYWWFTVKLDYWRYRNENSRLFEYKRWSRKNYQLHNDGRSCKSCRFQLSYP